MRFSGIGASEGLAVGKLVVFTHPPADAARSGDGCSSSSGPDAELERFREGRRKTAAELERLARETTEKFGADKAGIFEGYLEILLDGEIEESVALLLGDGISAESAVHQAMSALAEEFAAMDGEYMRERASDIEDLGRRLEAAVAGRETAALPVLAAPSVLAADDLSPAETVRLDLSQVLALAVDRGGQTCHVAILARSLGIPCVVGLGDFSSRAADGALCAVDGGAGFVDLDPSASLAESYHSRAALRKAELERLSAGADRKAFTSDGLSVAVCANVGSAEEVSAARAFGADGVGLFRTEFLYMGGAKLPSEDEQYDVYARAVEKLEGRPLTIRTLDIGGDKDLPALALVKEDNPFLGYRAVRVSLARPDVFKPQIRAALRAAALGPVELMFPLVISVDEARELKAVVASCRADLAAEAVPFGTVPVGVMIETPAAALCARALAAEFDFFSIGTNDLTQYTLAVDRGNSRISALYDPFNPAVLRLIAETCAAAREAGIPVGMCGEFASDPRAVPFLLGVGLNEFSVASSRIPAIKAAIRALDSSSCRKSAADLLSLRSLSEIHAALDPR